MASYSLTAPDGTKVSVDGAERRDALLGRGYTEAASAKPAVPVPVPVNSETKPTGRK